MWKARAVLPPGTACGDHFSLNAQGCSNVAQSWLCCELTPGRPCAREPALSMSSCAFESGGHHEWRRQSGRTVLCGEDSTFRGAVAVAASIFQWTPAKKHTQLGVLLLYACSIMSRFAPQCACATSVVFRKRRCHNMAFDKPGKTGALSIRVRRLLAIVKCRLTDNELVAYFGFRYLNSCHPPISIKRERRGSELVVK